MLRMSGVYRQALALVPAVLFAFSFSALAQDEVPPLRFEGWGKRVPTPDRYKVSDDLFISPPLLEGPIVDCAAHLHVTGLKPGASAELFVNGDLLATEESGEYDTYVEFDLSEATLNAGDRLKARQSFDGTSSDFSVTVAVTEFAVAYPDGLPRPRFYPAPIYQCGGAVRCLDLPKGGRVHLFNESTGEDRGTAPEYYDAANVRAAINDWGDVWRNSERIFAVSSMCGRESEASLVIEARHYPHEHLPQINKEKVKAYGGTRLVVIDDDNLVNSASFVILEESGEAIRRSIHLKGISAQYLVNRKLDAGEKLSVYQYLCIGTESIITILDVLPCDQLPFATIQNPKPGDTQVFLSSYLDGANILVVTDAGEEIGDGSGPSVPLKRPLNEGEVLTVVQRIGDCTGDKSYQVEVKRPKYIVMFVIDGLHPELLDHYIKTIAPSEGGFRQLQQGRKAVTACNSQGVFPSLTMPNMASLITGLTPSKTRVHGNRYYYRRPNRFTNDPHSDPGPEKIEWSSKGLQAAVYGFMDIHSTAEPYSVLSEPGYPFDAREALNGLLTGGSQKKSAGSGALDRYLEHHNCRTVYEYLANAGFSSHVVFHQISKGAGHPVGLDEGHLKSYSQGWTPPTAQKAMLANFPLNDETAFFEHFDANAKKELVGSDERQGLIYQWYRHGVGLPNLLTVYFAGFDHTEHNSGVTTDLDNLKSDMDVLDEIDAAIQEIYLTMHRYFPDETKEATFIVVSDHSLKNTRGGTPENNFKDLRMITRDNIYSWNGANTGIGTGKTTPWYRLSGGPPDMTFGAATAHIYGHLKRSWVREMVWWLGKAGMVSYAIHRPSHEVTSTVNYWKPTGEIELLIPAKPGDNTGPLTIMDATTVPYLRLNTLLDESLDDETFPNLMLMSNSAQGWRFGSSPPEPYTLDIAEELEKKGIPSWVVSLLPGDLGYRIPPLDILPSYGEHGWLSTTRNTTAFYSPFFNDDRMIENVRIIDIAPTICSLFGISSQGMDGTPIFNGLGDITDKQRFAKCSGLHSIPHTTREDLLKEGEIIYEVGPGFGGFKVDEPE